MCYHTKTHIFCKMSISNHRNVYSNSYKQFTFLVYIKIIAFHYYLYVNMSVIYQVKVEGVLVRDVIRKDAIVNVLDV